MAEEEGALAVAAPAVAAPGPVPTAGLHGGVTPFDPNQDDWCEYIERLEHYYTANDIDSVEKRRAILFNAVGASTYRLIRTLVSPSKVTDLSFADIVERARAPFNPKPSLIVKRFEFNTRRQKEGESIPVYVAELRKLAEYCEYGTTLSDMLRDRLVCGIRDSAVQRRLLQQQDLTFDKAMDIAVACETADKDSKRLNLSNLSTAPDKDNQIRKVKDNPYTTPSAPKRVDNGRRGKPFNKRGKRQGTQYSPQTKEECYRCGGEHNSSSCQYKEYLCNYCGKRGHLSRKCRKRIKDQEDGTHRVTSEVQFNYEHGYWKNTCSLSFAYIVG